MSSRTRNNITKNDLINIGRILNRIISHYYTLHSGFFANRALLTPLNEMTMSISAIFARRPYANEDQSYTNFKKFVDVMHALTRFLCTQRALSKANAFDYLQIEKLIVTELSLQAEVTLDMSLPVLQEISRAVHHLELLAMYSRSEDALFTDKWEVNNAVSKFPLWSKFIKDTQDIFSQNQNDFDAIQHYLPKMLAELEIMAGGIVETSALGTCDQNESDYLQRVSDAQNSAIAFRKEAEIFTKANFIKLLTDCLIKYRKFTNQVDTKWLIDHIMKPFFKILDTMDEERSKEMKEKDNQMYILTFTNNIQKIVEHSGSTGEYKYDISGCLIYISSMQNDAIPTPAASPGAQNQDMLPALTRNASRR